MSRWKNWFHGLVNKIKGIEWKKRFLASLPYLIFGYVFNKFSWQYRISDGVSIFEKLMYVMGNVTIAFANPIPSFEKQDVFLGMLAGSGLWVAVLLKGKNAKKFRHGREYGSARWGTAKDIAPYMDSVFENNIILTETEFLMMMGRPKFAKYARNKNIIVIGGSGSGKTRFFAKPNLMQMHSSYVVTDPKGSARRSHLKRVGTT